MELYTMDGLPENPKVKRAATNLMLSFYFLGAMSVGMRRVNVPKGHPFNPMDTMATDGISIYYCDDFVERHTMGEVMAVLAHEVLHKFFKHHLRRGNRDPMLWNVACDLAINPILKDLGFHLPKDCLFDEKYAGKAAEEIYEDLYRNAKKVSAPGWGNVTEPTHQDGSGLSKSEQDALARQVDIDIHSTAGLSKKQGNLPGFAEQWLSDFKESHVDYRELLPKYVSGGKQPTDYTMRRYNRKHYSLHGMILPTMQDLHAGCVVMMLDTSGSVSDEELRQFLGEVDALHKQFSPEKLIVLQCDADVTQVDEFGPDDEIVAVKVKGRGGTSFVPPFRWLEKNDIIPDAVVYLTDLCCDSFPPEPSFPVLWVSSRPGKAPFGEISLIDVHQD